MVFIAFYLFSLSFALAENLENGIYSSLNSNATFQNPAQQNEKLSQQYAPVKKDGELRSFYEAPPHPNCPNTYYPEILSKLLDILFGLLNYSSDLSKISDVLMLLKKNVEVSPLPQERELLNLKLNLIEKLLQNVPTSYVRPGGHVNVNGAKTTVIFKNNLPAINQPGCRDEFGHLMQAAYDSYVQVAQFKNCQVNDVHLQEMHIPPEHSPFEIIYNDVHPSHIHGELPNKPIDPFMSLISKHSSPQMPHYNDRSYHYELPSNNLFNTWPLPNEKPEIVNNPMNQPVLQPELNALLSNPALMKGLLQNTNKWPDHFINHPGGSAEPTDFSNNLINYLYDTFVNGRPKEGINVPPHDLAGSNAFPPNTFLPQQGYPGNLVNSHDILNPYAKQNDVKGDDHSHVHGQNVINSLNANQIVPLKLNIDQFTSNTITKGSLINPSPEDIINLNNDNSKGKAHEPDRAIDYSVLLSQLGLIPPPHGFKDHGAYYKPHVDLSDKNPNHPNHGNSLYVLQNNQQDPYNLAKNVLPHENTVMPQGQNLIQTNLNNVPNYDNINPYGNNPQEQNPLPTNLNNVPNSDNINLFGSHPQDTILDHYKIPIQYDKVTVNHDVIPYILEYISSLKNSQGPNQNIDTNYGNLVGGNGVPYDLQRYLGVANQPNLPNKAGMIELTYVLKTPTPKIYNPVYYVKYRVPYNTFMDKYKNHVSTPTLRLQPAKLYQELLTASNISEVSTDLKGYKKDDLLKIVFDSGALVDAKLINGQDNSLNEQVGIVQNLNSNVSPEEILLQTNVSLSASTTKVPVELKETKKENDTPAVEVSAKNPQEVLPNPYLNVVQQPNPYLYGIPTGYQNYPYRNPNILAAKPYLFNPRIIGK